MEVILGLVIIGALLVMLGVDLFYILLGVMILLALALAATLLFFIFTAVRLVRSKRVSAAFSRIEKPEKGFSRAVYESSEGELVNSFPCEMIFRSRLYKPGRTETVLVSRGGGAYDRYSRITVVAGLILGGVSMFWIARWLIYLLENVM